MSHVDFTKEFKTLISLCTGMGGLEHGIERTGVDLRALCYVEIEVFIIENMVQQMEQGLLDEAPVWSNLKTFNGRPFRGMVDIITGGFPCQPFSVAGKQLAGEDPRHLWPYIGKGESSIVGTVRPICCFFENVPGLLNLGYREVRSDLEQLGYKVEEGIFSAEEAGAPHQRKRLFILAVDNAHRERLKQEYQIQARRNTVEYAGEGELEHSKSGRSGELRNEISERKGHGASGASRVLSEELADPNSSGSRENTQCCQLRTEGVEQSSCNCGRANEREGQEGQEGDKWPACPGEQQYEWEEPRTESRLGFTVNGYNYREDLLRMAGNGVVEQAAEVAWRTLWSKMQ